jgi:hypothetical protein
MAKWLRKVHRVDNLKGPEGVVVLVTLQADHLEATANELQ